MGLLDTLNYSLLFWIITPIAIVLLLILIVIMFKSRKNIWRWISKKVFGTIYARVWRQDDYGDWFEHIIKVEEIRKNKISLFSGDKKETWVVKHWYYIDGFTTCFLPYSSFLAGQLDESTPPEAALIKTEDLTVNNQTITAEVFSEHMDHKILHDLMFAMSEPQDVFGKYKNLLMIAGAVILMLVIYFAIKGGGTV